MADERVPAREHQDRDGDHNYDWREYQKRCRGGDSLDAPPEAKGSVVCGLYSFQLKTSGCHSYQRELRDKRLDENHRGAGTNVFCSPALASLSNWWSCRPEK
jgi:hypothetical protein